MIQHPRFDSSHRAIQAWIAVVFTTMAASGVLSTARARDIKVPGAEVEIIEITDRAELKRLQRKFQQGLMNWGMPHEIKKCDKTISVQVRQDFSNHGLQGESLRGQSFAALCDVNYPHQAYSFFMCASEPTGKFSIASSGSTDPNWLSDFSVTNCQPRR